jgi:transcriptional regulator with GAF, ATPase, and Fis domain
MAEHEALKLLRALAQLEQANSDLEARVTARTAELTAALAEVERLKSRLQQENGGDVLTLEALERAHIITVLKKTHGVIEGPKGAARLLDLKPSTARFRMKKLGITKPDYL